MKKKLFYLGFIIFTFSILISLTGCGVKESIVNETLENAMVNSDDNNSINNYVTENIVNNAENNTSLNTGTLKLDARYGFKNEAESIQIDLYSDNTIYFAYVPMSSNIRSEYYYGTFEIRDNKLILNLEPDDETRTTIMDKENPREYTIISNESFQDSEGTIYEYKLDYKKNQYSSQINN